jgi:phosphopantetheine adenylyltransferase
MPCSLLTSGNPFDQRATENDCFLKKKRKRKKKVTDANDARGNTLEDSATHS